MSLPTIVRSKRCNAYGCVVLLSYLVKVVVCLEVGVEHVQLGGDCGLGDDSLESGNEISPLMPFSVYREVVILDIRGLLESTM